MRFQKILTLVSLIIGALSFVFAVLFCSGIIYESMAYTTEYSGDSLGDDPIGADALFNFTQGANNALVILAIVLILTVVFLYITSTNKRRNYYITNYIAIGIAAVYAIVFAIVLIAICGQAAGYASQIDMAKWLEYVQEVDTDRYGQTFFVNPQRYSESYATIALGFVLAVVVLAEAAAWVLNLLWKIKLMKGEKALLAGNYSKEVA